MFLKLQTDHWMLCQNLRHIHAAPRDGSHTELWSADLVMQDTDSRVRWWVFSVQIRGLHCFKTGPRCRFETCSEWGE